MERQVASWLRMRGRALRLFAPASLVLAGWLAFAGSEPSSAQAQASGARFEGVATCAGSTCHGRSEGNGAIVRQDEIASWQEPSSASGAHSRAYSVLASRRGRQIAQSLGLGAATSAPACLGCHATYVPQSRRGAHSHVMFARLRCSYPVPLFALRKVRFPPSGRRKSSGRTGRRIASRACYCAAGGILRYAGNAQVRRKCLPNQTPAS